MPDLYAIVGALEDQGRINQNEATELCGTTSRPRYNDVLSILEEKNYLTPEERKTLTIPNPERLYTLLQQKGVLQ